MPPFGDDGVPAGVTAETTTAALAALPAEPGPAGLPADTTPSGLAADAPQEAPAVAAAEAPPHDGVVVVVVVDDVTGGEVVVTGGGDDVAGGSVVVGGGWGGGDVVVVGDPVDGEVVVGGAWVGGGVAVVDVAIADTSPAGATVELSPLFAIAPPDCAALSAHASGLGSASRRQRAIGPASKAADHRRVIAASPAPERHGCRLHAVALR